MKILVIDDNQSIVTMITKYLTLKGNECTVANNGKKGLELILQEKFDVIILDIAMPEMTGREVIDNLEKIGKLKEKNIVLFTASGMSPEEIASLKIKGVKAVLRKPVELDNLDKTIASFQN